MTQDERRRALGLSQQVCALASLAMERFGLDEWEALRMIYASMTYRLLADEKTKVWHYSVPALFEILKTERETGSAANSPYAAGLVE